MFSGFVVIQCQSFCLTSVFPLGALWIWPLFLSFQSFFIIFIKWHCIYTYTKSFPTYKTNFLLNIMVGKNGGTGFRVFNVNLKWMSNNNPVTSRAPPSHPTPYTHQDLMCINEDQRTVALAQCDTWCNDTLTFPYQADGEHQSQCTLYLTKYRDSVLNHVNSISFLLFEPFCDIKADAVSVHLKDCQLHV